MTRIYPSLIAADLLNLKRDIKRLEPYAAGFHCDVMDFQFVPNHTMGPDVINAIRAVTTKMIWVHLMVDNPLKYLERLRLTPGDIVSVHAEVHHPLDEIIEAIRDNKLTPSIALSPETPLSVIDSYLTKIHQVLIMSVRPGFSGQAFIPSSIDRVKVIAELVTSVNPKIRIGIDGGINLETLGLVVKAGAQDIVVGSALFNAADPVEALKHMTKITQ